MTEKPKFIEYDGLIFTRDEKTGYYLNSTNRVRLHRYVWEKEIGKIPKGYEIHHINRNKADNRIENLRLLSCSEHRKLHAVHTEEEKERMRKNLAENVRPKASEWHKSAEGREWHKQQYQRVKERFKRDFGKSPLEIPRVEKVCEHCGKSFIGIEKSRFCSNVCKSAWRRKAGLDNVVRICKLCGKEFKVNKYSKQQFCSKKCGSKHHTIINEEKRKMGIPVNRPKATISRA